MTPAPVPAVQYSRFSCPNQACPAFNQPGQGHIRHRSWTGKTHSIERLSCICCGREFSEREGTLMARTKLPEDTVVQLLKCQRWGVCDEGTADICAVDIKTVQRFQPGAFPHAQEHHQQVVQHLKVDGVQLDEAHSKRRPRQVAALRRRTRCLSWSQVRHQGRIWLLVSLYNWVLPHKSLRQNGQRRTPAMALGLTDHVWSYHEYLWLPVHLDEVGRQQMRTRLDQLLTPALTETERAKRHGWVRSSTRTKRRRRQKELV